MTDTHYRTLIVVAHRGGARLFESRGRDSDWELLSDIDHPEGAAKTSELVSDQRGQIMESHRDGQHGAQPRVDPTEQVADRFARVLAERLRHFRVGNELGRLVLIAPPAFLGRLRGALDAPTAELIVAELALGLAHAKPDEIREKLAEQIRL